MPALTPAPRRHARARRGITLVAAAATAAASLLTAMTVTAGPAAAGGSSVIDGPDVASYQHPYGKRIDWHKVARSGHEFAIVKATEGTSYRNPWFRKDYGGARRAGMVRGSYHFARPGYPVVRTAERQARFYVRHLGDSATTRRTLPPALDLESTGGLGRGALVTWAQTFLLETRRLTDRIPMIYTYPSFWTGPLGDPAALARYPLWMASYESHPVSSTALWQYTSRASVRGIRGSVDMSRVLTSAEQWRALSDGHSPDPWPVATPGAPQRVHATGGDAGATISWLPGDTGSNPVTGYRITAQPGGTTKTVDALHFRTHVGGLVNGLPYTFTVTALNRHGAGDDARTGTVVPLVPVTLTVDAPPTTYGDDAKVRVRLTRTDTRRALAGRELALERRDPATGDWVAVKALVTGAKGWAATTLTAPQHSTELRFTFAAPQGWEQVRRVVPVVVTNGVTAKLSKSRVHSGHPVTLRGHVTPAVAGVTVRRQAYYRHSWHSLQRTTVDASGDYALKFTPHTHVKTTKHYRVVVEAFDHRAHGVSPVRHLLVRR